MHEKEKRKLEGWCFVAESPFIPVVTHNTTNSTAQHADAGALVKLRSAFNKQKWKVNEERKESLANFSL